MPLACVLHAESEGDRAHLAVLRERLVAHGGEEADATGNALVAVFAGVADVLACAVAMQRARDDGSLRIGVDAGEPARDGGDLYGPPVVVAAALCDAAAGGEILVSEVVRLLAGAGSDRDGAVALEPAGALRVRGAGGPVSFARVRWEAAACAPEAAAPGRETTVVIADDQRLVRAGFRVILDAEPDIRVVGEAPDGRTAVDVVRRRAPDVVLMDIRMPGTDGLQAAQEILADPALSTHVLMLTTFDAGEYVYEALRIGAAGFLLKDAPAERLLEAVRVAAAGDALLEPRITRRLIEEFGRGGRRGGAGLPPAVAELTGRELEVLRLVARGLSNAEIAAELILGESTVKTHVARMLAKLGLRDRVQAVVLAYETGVVEPEP